MGKVRNEEVKVTGIIDANADDTVTMVMTTDLEETLSNSNAESDNGEDFTAGGIPPK